MSTQTKFLKDFIWHQIMLIWFDPDIDIDEKVNTCTALSDYMHRL